MTGKGATYETVREKITEEQYSYDISELLTIPEKMKKILEDKERIQWFAAKYANAHDVFFVGRGIDYSFREFTDKKHGKKSSSGKSYK